MGFLNGLSLMGSNMAAFAGTAGLEQQKSDLAKQSLVLADQLATTRESAGRQEAGQIAMTAAQQEQGYKTGESALQRTSSEKIAAGTNQATLGAATIQASASTANTKTLADVDYAKLSQAAPGELQRTQDLRTQDALNQVKLDNSSKLNVLNSQLSTEMGKPNPDPTVVASLKAQGVALGNSAESEAALATARQKVYVADQQAVAQLNTRLLTGRTAENTMDMGDPGRKALKAENDSLESQLDVAQKMQSYSAAAVHPGMGAAIAAPPGAPQGGAWGAGNTIYRAPDGKLYDKQGQPTTAPGQPQPPAPGIINNGFGPGGPR